jgi:hypothetical protein
MSHSSIPEKTNSSVISDWRPEDPEFWQQRGHRVASRNLWISVPCLLLAFCVWMLFSAVAVNLNKVGFQFTTDQLFMLTALPALSGALLRVPYAFMVPLFGGRRWTAFSTGIMIVPCVWLGFAVQDTSTPFSVFVIISLLCGFAGANFASSMANISFFFPKQKQGGALGINGGLGNMGVSVMQLVAPLVVSLSIFRRLWRYRQRAAGRLHAVSGKRGVDLGAVPDYLHPGGVVLYERPVGVEGVAERAAAGTEARCICGLWRCSIWPPSARLSASRRASPCCRKPSSRMCRFCTMPSSGRLSARWRVRPAGRSPTASAGPA